MMRSRNFALFVRQNLGSVSAMKIFQLHSQSRGKRLTGLECDWTYRAIHSPFTLNGTASFQGCTGG
jgi:hypothetical protein